MRRRVLPIVGSFGLSVAAIFWQGNALAQDLYVTNLDQFVAEAYSPDYCLVLPFSPWDWRAFSLYGGEPWWLDCSQMSCDGLFQTSTELSGGVPAYAVVLLQNVLTGETIIQPDGLTDVVATVLAPSGYQPATNSWNGWMWNWYEQVVDQPDSWGLSPGEVPPPVITFRALLADVSNYAAYAAYESNLEAEAEAAQAAQAATATMSGGGFAMDDDDDDGGVDPCTLTSLTQPFYVTNISPERKRVYHDHLAVLPVLPLSGMGSEFFEHEYAMVSHRLRLGRNQRQFDLLDGHRHHKQRWEYRHPALLPCPAALGQSNCGGWITQRGGEAGRHSLGVGQQRRMFGRWVEQQDLCWRSK